MRNFFIGDLYSYKNVGCIIVRVTDRHVYFDSQITPVSKKYLNRLIEDKTIKEGDPGPLDKVQFAESTYDISLVQTQDKEFAKDICDYAKCELQRRRHLGKDIFTEGLSTVKLCCEEDATVSLIKAVYNGNFDSATTALKAGADPNTHLDADGEISKYNLITQAGLLKYYDIVVLLGDYGARY